MVFSSPAWKWEVEIPAGVFVDIGVLIVQGSWLLKVPIVSSLLIPLRPTDLLGVVLESRTSHWRACISASVFRASSSSSHKVITSSRTPTPSLSEGIPSPLPRPTGLARELSSSMVLVKLSNASSYSSVTEKAWNLKSRTYNIQCTCRHSYLKKGCLV